MLMQGNGICPADIYLLNVNNRNIKLMYDSKLTVKTQRRQRRRSVVFI